MNGTAKIELEPDFLAVRQCRQGRRQAFEPLVRRYMKDAYRIALGLVGNPDDALDLSQEAFCRAYTNLGLLRDDTKFFPWFYQILRNLCFSALRDRQANPVSSFSADYAPPPSAADAARFSPELIAQSNERRQAVWRAIGKLNPKHREMIVLFHFQNLSYQEIARALYCTQGTVMSRLFHARRHLKDLLKKEKGVF